MRSPSFSFSQCDAGLRLFPRHLGGRAVRHQLQPHHRGLLLQPDHQPHPDVLRRRCAEVLQVRGPKHILDLEEYLSLLLFLVAGLICFIVYSHRRGPYAFAATDFKGYDCAQAWCPKGDNPKTSGGTYVYQYQYKCFLLSQTPSPLQYSPLHYLVVCIN